MLKDSIKKRLDTLKEKIKFYRNIVFAVMSAVVWNSYNFPMAKGFFINILGLRTREPE